MVRLVYKGRVDQVEVEDPRELEAWLQMFSEDKGLSSILGISLKISVVKQVLGRQCGFVGEHS